MSLLAPKPIFHEIVPSWPTCAPDGRPFGTLNARHGLECSVTTIPPSHMFSDPRCGFHISPITNRLSPEWCLSYRTRALSVALLHRSSILVSNTGVQTFHAQLTVSPSSHGSLSLHLRPVHFTYESNAPGAQVSSGPDLSTSHHYG